LTAGREAAFGLAAAGVGALFALSAFVVSPLILPAALLLGALAAVTLARPEVGIAAAFLMVPLGNVGLTGSPPWLLLAVWSVFLAALALFREGTGPRSEGLPRLVLVSLLYGLAAAVGAFTVADSLGAAQPVLRSLATGLLLFFAIGRLVRTWAEAHWVIAGVAGALLLTGAHGTWEYLTGASDSVGFLTGSGALVGRATAGFAQPNQLGGFLVVLMPFAVAGLILAKRAKPFYLAALGLSTLAVYASFSRGSLLALGLVPLIFAGRRLLLAAPLLGILLAVATPGLLQERFGTLTNGTSEISSRVDIWKTALSIWADNPVTGVGPGGFPEAYAEARVPGKEFLPATLFEPPPHAHNLFLHVLSEGGLLGFVLLLAVLTVAFRVALDLRRSDERWMVVIGTAGLASLAAFFVHNQFDVTLLEGTGVYFWALLGLLSGLSAAARAREVPEGGRHSSRRLHMGQAARPASRT